MAYVNRGATSTGMSWARCAPWENPSLLVTQDFRTVNRHFSLAFESGL